MRTCRIVLGATVVAGLLWLALFLTGAGRQDTLFFDRGESLLSDYWMPSECVRGGYARTDGLFESGWFEPEDLRAGKTTPGRHSPTAVFRTGYGDRVYPAFALLPFKLLPMCWTSGWCWTIGAALVFLLSLLPSAGGVRAPLALAFSMPFVFNLERGNPVWLSAAAVAVFLAWWNDERLTRRSLAAVCLAIAVTMKVSPVVLGLLYVPEILRTRFGGASLKMPLLAAGCAALFFVVPWLWVPDGFDGIPAFLANARHHADFVLRCAEFGFVQLWRSVRLVQGLDINAPWTGMMAVARLSQLLGLGALLVGVRRKDALLLVGGMLFLAGNMYYYGALYLFPAFLLQRRSLDWKEGLLWFAILCPVQFVFAGHSSNQIICNAALCGLMALRLIGFAGNRSTGGE